MSALAPLGRSALAYAGHLRLHVLPLLPRKKEPDGRLVPHGFRDATTARGAISAWWTVAPQANVGIACAPSGVVVIDVDPRNGGDESLAALEREIGSLPRTWTVLTPSGGAHYYLRHQGSTVAGTLGPGLDVKHQGYVVAPPSVHPNGGVYAWDLGAHPLESAIAPIPVAWLARLTRDRVAAAPLERRRRARVVPGPRLRGARLARRAAPGRPADGLLPVGSGAFRRARRRSTTRRPCCSRAA